MRGLFVAMMLGLRRDRQRTLLNEVSSGSRARMDGTSAGRPLDPKQLKESLQRGSRQVCAKRT
jgi:hypothetical protein